MGTLCVAAFFEKNRLITPIWIVLKIGEIKARGAQKAEATSVAEHFLATKQRRDRLFSAQSLNGGGDHPDHAHAHGLVHLLWLREH